MEIFGCVTLPEFLSILFWIYCTSRLIYCDSEKNSMTLNNSTGEKDESRRTRLNGIAAVQKAPRSQIRFQRMRSDILQILYK